MNSYVWHVYWEYCEAKFIAVSDAFRSYPLEAPLNYDFMLYLRQSGTGSGQPSICKLLFIIWTFYIKIRCFSMIHSNYKLESHRSTDSTGNSGVLLLNLVVLQHLHLSLK